MRLVPRWLSAVPGTIAGLVGGTLFFQLAAAVSPHTLPDGWVVGALPGVEAFGFRPTGASLGALPWAALLLPAVTLAVLLGSFLLIGAGFAQPAEIHNAAHDVRHGLSFPCH